MLIIIFYYVTWSKRATFCSFQIFVSLSKTLATLNLTTFVKVSTAKDIYFTVEFKKETKLKEKSYHPRAGEP